MLLCVFLCVNKSHEWAKTNSLDPFPTFILKQCNSAPKPLWFLLKTSIFTNRPHTHILISRNIYFSRSQALRFRTVSWAHAVICSIPSCVWQSGEQLSLSIMILTLVTYDPVQLQNVLYRLLLKHWTTFSVFCCSCPQCGRKVSLPSNSE